MPAHHGAGYMDTSTSCAALGSDACRCLAPQKQLCRGWCDPQPPQNQQPLHATQGAFLGIFAVAGINQALESVLDTSLLIPSLGATAVLIFGVPESKLSQPRNVLLGQMISAIVGIATRNVLGSVLWVSAPVGMSLALLAMRLTSTTHPPGAKGPSCSEQQPVPDQPPCAGGATALIAASAVTPAPWAGWMFLPAVTLSTIVLLIVALLVNNVLTMVSYPRYWWGADGIFR